MPTSQEWERAAEHWVVQQGCTFTRRALRTRFNKQDYFAADVCGKMPGATYYVQVTKGHGNVSVRKRKLEQIPWVPTDRVFVFECRVTRDPVNASREVHWFRVHRYDSKTKEWTVDPEAIRIPRKWFKARLFRESQ